MSSYSQNSHIHGWVGGLWKLAYSCWMRRLRAAYSYSLEALRRGFRGGGACCGGGGPVGRGAVPLGRGGGGYAPVPFMLGLVCVPWVDTIGASGRTGGRARAA